MLQPTSHVKRNLNPEVGLPAFDFTHLWLGPQEGPRVTVYSPVDEVSGKRLDLLHRIVLAERARERTQEQAQMAV